MEHQFTIGIEEEFQVIDKDTGNLCSHVQKIFEGGQLLLKEQMKHEMHQAVVEMGTKICKNVHDAREEVTFLRKHLIGLANDQGLRVAAAGTHPFTHWNMQEITDDPRYDTIVNEMKDVARSNLIFGLHVHVAIPNREEGIKIMNEARYFIPHIYALSTNSPFWVGRETGFKSYRSKVFDKFPRTGIPPIFQSVAELDQYVDILIKTNCIDNGKKIWWDIRLHPFFPTIEWRMCDVVMRVDEVICLAAVMQCVIAKIHSLHKKNLSFRSYHFALINENKWRAARYGIEADLIDFGKEIELPFNILIEELLEFIDDVVDELDCRNDIDYVHQILKMGTGADRQLKIYNETKDFSKLMDYIVEETSYGIKF